MNLFSVIINFVRELLISNMHNKFEQDTWKTFLKLSRPQGQITDVEGVVMPTSKCKRRRRRTLIAIAHLFYQN